MNAEGRLPVVIGIGEAINRPTVPAEAREPAALIAEAVGAAVQDARLGRAISRVDALDVVNILSWTYADPVRAIAEESGLGPVAGHYTAPSGDEPTLRIAAAAQQIAAGELELAIVCGGESARSRAVLAKASVQTPWDKHASTSFPGPYYTGLSPAARAHGLVGAPNVYALCENAHRAARGESFARSQSRSAAIWSAFSRVAAETPGAWLPRVTAAAEIEIPSQSNRMIAYPYTKLMCANPTVDQAAAVIVASAAAARRLGIPSERWVYIHADAGANDTVDVLQRPSYSESAPLAAALADLMVAAEADPDELDLVDLYSCFPIVPKLGAELLGLSIDRALSVCGGLTFFGGPGCAYPACAAVALVRRLRADEGRLGLLHANGAYLTNQHALVLGIEPPAGGIYRPDVNRRARQARLTARASPELDLAPNGDATIETFTVLYGREGPEAAIVIGRLHNGKRFLARTPDDPDTLNELVDPTTAVIGRDGRVRPGENTNLFELAA